MMTRFQIHKPTESARQIRLSFCLFLVASHSILLGSYIFFYTNQFYDFFFDTSVDNYFFVKQAGLFLFCLGLFYFMPMANLKAHHRLVDMIILTKILAVTFLLPNYSLVPKAWAIFLAAGIDALFALILAYYSHAAGLLLKSASLKQDIPS